MQGMRSRLLIVDDSDVVRQALRSVLRANPDWEVCGEASDGLAAMEMFTQLKPHLVIVDFQLPGLNGVETARRMLEMRPSTPIVMLTQYDSADVEAEARKVGIKSVVTKTDVFSMVGMIEELLPAKRAGWNASTD